MNTGKHYYNNGVEERRFFSDNVPFGYIKGRLPSVSNHMKGKAGHSGKC